MDVFQNSTIGHCSQGLTVFYRADFLQRVPVQDANKIVHTIIVGAPAETAKAADVLSHEPIKRNITILTALADLKAAILLQPTGEIIFVQALSPIKRLLDVLKPCTAILIINSMLRKAIVWWAVCLKITVAKR